MLHLLNESRTEREGRRREREKEREREREREREICGMFAESAQQINDLFA